MRVARHVAFLALAIVAALGLPAPVGSGSLGSSGDGFRADSLSGEAARLAVVKTTGLATFSNFQEPVGFLIARPRGSSLGLHSSPRGPVVARLGTTTEFGSSLRLGVVKDRGKWLGVVSTRLPNGKLGWVKRTEVDLSRTEISLVLDLSRRRLLLKRGDTVVRRMVVGVGRPSSPTPQGRFAVTDKLSGYRYSAAYGCCIVALSAHQPNLPAGWTGGNRIAIHGTNDPSSIGVASSAGCPHAGYADMQALMRRVPLGAPVFIRA
jgi:lipoprotein-anchoring transpeptidase ErfK/SrfK